MALRRRASVQDAVRDHYRTLWGQPSREAEFRTSDLAITTLKWDASATSEGVDLHLTRGASDEDMPGMEPGHRVECVLGLSPGRDDVAPPLAALGLYARREGVTVDHGHTMPNDGPLWPGTPMSTFLVTRHVDQLVPSLEPSAGNHVEFLQAVPVHRSEVSFKAAHGVDALMARWQQRDVPFWDPDRLPEPASHETIGEFRRSSHNEIAVSRARLGLHDVDICGAVRESAATRWSATPVTSTRHARRR